HPLRASRGERRGVRPSHLLYAQPRRRFRRRGEAANPDRHVRAVGRLLRRVLPEGAEGASADRARLRAGVRAGRRDRRPDRADAGVRARPEDQRPDPDVSERHLHDRREPRGSAGDVGAVRLRGHVAGRLAADRAGARGRPAAATRPSFSTAYGLARTRAVRVRVRPAVDWEIVVGLEIHTQLATASKIFSGASTRYGAPPNTQASLVDLGYPGTLPVLNREAVVMAIKFGLATGCEIARRSVFARKNYFYPDLPKGYQISQYELPIVHGGKLEIELPDGTRKT